MVKGDKKMSKIFEVNSCYECESVSIFVTKNAQTARCAKTGKEINCDFRNAVDADCPLKDSNYWKKGLVDWINRQRIDSDWPAPDDISIDKLLQKIEEM